MYNIPMEAWSLAQDMVAVDTFLAVLIPEVSSSLINITLRRLKSAVTSSFLLSSLNEKHFRKNQLSLLQKVL